MNTDGIKFNEANKDSALTILTFFHRKYKSFDRDETERDLEMCLEEMHSKGGRDYEFSACYNSLRDIVKEAGVDVEKNELWLTKSFSEMLGICKHDGDCILLTTLITCFYKALGGDVRMSFMPIFNILEGVKGGGSSEDVFKRLETYMKASIMARPPKAEVENPEGYNEANKIVAIRLLTKMNKGYSNYKEVDIVGHLDSLFEKVADESFPLSERELCVEMLSLGVKEVDKPLVDPKGWVDKFSMFVGYPGDMMLLTSIVVCIFSDDAAPSSMDYIFQFLMSCQLEAAQLDDGSTIFDRLEHRTLFMAKG